MIAWDKHVCKVGTMQMSTDSPPSDDKIWDLRKKIEPWLSAVFQGEHFSLLLGSGFTLALASAAKAPVSSMGLVELGQEYEDVVNAHTLKTAEASGRGGPNIEDQIRSVISLIGGLEIINPGAAEKWRDCLDSVLAGFLESVLKTECGIAEGIATDASVKNLLVSFLLSFASRTTSRERLQLFTTNYDRLVEHGCDLVGLRVIDRFVGSITPVFRSSRCDVDFHYNPPGIRGEPRYLEGVIKLTKLHGSIDWRFENRQLKRYGIPFGASMNCQGVPKDPTNTVMIYPNPAKDVETSEYPYAELFRDFSAAICRPNSVLVTYGYGFGDDHINRVIEDMLSIPSTHLVIISYDLAGGRIPNFCDKVAHHAQVSLLIGSHFGELSNLVEHYLPKPAIDQISYREAELVSHRLPPGSLEPECGCDETESLP